MGKVTGFMEIAREERQYLPVDRRLKDFGEFTVNLSDAQLAAQGARCMDCGIPYCHTAYGCPLANLIPDWNDLVYRGEWRAAAEALHATNNFPEFTGRVCPAPCETACTLYFNDQPVTIKTIEHAIAERAWDEGWATPELPASLSGKRVAVVGAGPAGLACAQQLARAGHAVSVYDRQQRPGGLLRYGIPDFKLDKRIIDRRLAQMEAEGVAFHCGVHVGADLAADDLRRDFDAVVLAGGAEQPRDLDAPGRDLRGVHFAMDYLRGNTHRVQAAIYGDGDGDDGGLSCHPRSPRLTERGGDESGGGDGDGGDDGSDGDNGGGNGGAPEFISARGKHVVVIGGGDTGSDCIGTANRQGAASVTQIEILSEPPAAEDRARTWPNWPHKLRTSSSQEEGCARLWDVVTDAFIDAGAGRVAGIKCKKVAWDNAGGRWKMKAIPGSEFELPAGLVTLAMGFLHPVHDGMLRELGAELDARGNVAAADHGARAYRVGPGNLFAAGDMRRGQSLVVWAIREGRQCAQAVDRYLSGEEPAD